MQISDKKLINNFISQQHFTDDQLLHTVNALATADREKCLLYDEVKFILEMRCAIILWL